VILINNGISYKEAMKSKKLDEFFSEDDEE